MSWVRKPGRSPGRKFCEAPRRTRNHRRLRIDEVTCKHDYGITVNEALAYIRSYDE